jgi:voltage-gated sodium channel
MRAVFKAFSYLSTMAVHPLSWSFYLSFIFIVAFVFLNMMIGIVLETLQREHEQFDRDSGEGEAGEVHRIEARTREMEQRLIRMEALLQQQFSTHTKNETGTKGRF